MHSYQILRFLDKENLIEISDLFNRQIIKFTRRFNLLKKICGEKERKMLAAMIMH